MIIFILKTAMKRGYMYMKNCIPQAHAMLCKSLILRKYDELLKVYY